MHNGPHTLSVCILHIHTCVSHRGKQDAGKDAGQTLDEPLREPETCQSRGAPASLKREDLAFLEQGWQPPLPSQTHSP